MTSNQFHQTLYHCSIGPLEFTGGFTRPVSLDDEGFVHLCTLEQLDGVRKRFFAGKTVFVSAFDAGRLSDVRYEDSYGHGFFPHQYGPLPQDAMVNSVSLAPDVPTEAVESSR